MNEQIRRRTRANQGRERLEVEARERRRRRWRVALVNPSSPELEERVVEVEAPNATHAGVRARGGELEDWTVVSVQAASLTERDGGCCEGAP